MGNVSPIRPNRFKRLEEQLAEARDDKNLFKSALTRALADQATIEKLRYDLERADAVLAGSHDQNRQLAAAFLVRFGDTEFSEAELEEAYRNVPRVESVDEEAPGQRFRLNLEKAQRDLPKNRLEQIETVKAENTPPDTPAEGQTAEASPTEEPPEGSHEADPDGSSAN